MINSTTQNIIATIMMLAWMFGAYYWMATSDPVKSARISYTGPRFGFIAQSHDEINCPQKTNPEITCPTTPEWRQ